MPLPKKEEPLEKISAKQRVYEAIRTWIIEGQLQPGEKISDRDIADYFEVSRTPVREAIQLLEMQKLIKSYPGKATLVTEMETEKIEKWYVPMVTLQKLAVELAIDRVSEEDLQKLKELNALFMEAVKEQYKPMPILDADKKFHSYILQMAGNEYLQNFCDVLWIHIQRFEYGFFRDKPMELSSKEHEKLIEAFANHEKNNAVALIEEHWLRTQRTICEK